MTLNSLGEVTTHSFTACCPTLTHSFPSYHHLWQFTPVKRGLHDTETDVEVWAPYAVPFAGWWAALEPNVCTPPDNTTCHEQLPTLFQCWHPPSPPTFAMWYTDHFSLSHPPCGWDWPWRLFAWPCLRSSIKLSQAERKWAPFSHWLDGHTVFPIYGHHLLMNSGWFNTFYCQKSDNALLLLNRRTLQCEGHPVLTWSALSVGRHFLSDPLLSPAHIPIHAEDDHIPRCFAAFPYSVIDRYVNGNIVMTFCTFSFEQTLYIRHQGWSD